MLLLSGLEAQPLVLPVYVAGPWHDTGVFGAIVWHRNFQSDPTYYAAKVVYVDTAALNWRWLVWLTPRAEMVNDTGYAATRQQAQKAADRALTSAGVVLL